MVHRSVQLSPWSVTPDRDQRAFNTFILILKVLDSYGSLVGFKSNPPCSIWTAAGDEEMFPFLQQISALENFFDAQDMIPVLERILCETTPASEVAKRMSSVCNTMRTRFSTELKDFLTSAAVKDAMQVVQDTFIPLTKAEAKVAPAQTQGPHDHLANSKLFFQHANEQSTEKIANALEPVSDRLSLCKKVLQGLTWLRWDTAIQDAFNEAHKLMLTGHWINTMWCLLLLIQDNDIAGPRGKSLRHQLLQVKEGDIFQMLLSHERLDAKILDRIEDILSKDPQYKKSQPKKRALSKHQSDEFPERLPIGDCEAPKSASSAHAEESEPAAKRLRLRGMASPSESHEHGNNVDLEEMQFVPPNDDSSLSLQNLYGDDSCPALLCTADFGSSTAAPPLEPVDLHDSFLAEGDAATEKFPECPDHPDDWVCRRGPALLALDPRAFHCHVCKRILGTSDLDDFEPLIDFDDLGSVGTPIPRLGEPAPQTPVGVAMANPGSPPRSPTSPYEPACTEETQSGALILVPVDTYILVRGCITLPDEFSPVTAVVDNKEVSSIRVPQHHWVSLLEAHKAFSTVPPQELAEETQELEASPSEDRLLTQAEASGEDAPGSPVAATSLSSAVQVQAEVTARASAAARSGDDTADGSCVANKGIKRCERPARRAKCVAQSPGSRARDVDAKRAHKIAVAEAKAETQLEKKRERQAKAAAKPKAKAKAQA